MCKKWAQLFCFFGLDLYFMQLNTSVFVSINKLSNDPSVISRMFIVSSAGISHNVMTSIRVK